jgi:hypothetical protein
VNVLGHTHVALAGGRDDPEYLLGAVLPDLAAMAGIRVTGAAFAGALAAGIRSHHRTDAAFHAHPDFLAGSGALRRALVERDLALGPARAVGHAGWELLLDGTLVGTEVEGALGRAIAVGDRAAAGLAPAARDRWAAFLHRARRAPGPRYDDPAWVADRLHAMLERRPRLRLPVGQVATVAGVLASHAAEVAGCASRVLDDTTRAVAVTPVR